MQDDPPGENKMDSFGLAILIIFIIIRVLIAVGLVYLIIFEVRRYGRTHIKKEESDDGKEAGKHPDGSPGSRS